MCTQCWNYISHMVTGDHKQEAVWSASIVNSLKHSEPWREGHIMCRPSMIIMIIQKRVLQEFTTSKQECLKITPQIARRY